jgi:hypothetical protein
MNDDTAPEPETTTTSEMGLGEEARQKWWAAALWKMTEFPRFINFINNNYSFGYNKDGNPLEPLVVEKQLHIDVPADVVFKIGVACMQFGAREPTALAKRILQLLGQKESALILPGTETELKALNDAKTKLEP